MEDDRSFQGGTLVAGQGLFQPQGPGEDEDGKQRRREEYHFPGCYGQYCHPQEWGEDGNKKEYGKDERHYPRHLIADKAIAYAGDGGHQYCGGAHASDEPGYIHHGEAGRIGGCDASHDVQWKPETQDRQASIAV